MDSLLMPDLIYVVHYLASAPSLEVRRTYFKNLDSAKEAGETLAKNRKWQLHETPVWTNVEDVEVLLDENGNSTAISITEEWLF